MPSILLIDDSPTSRQWLTGVVQPLAYDLLLMDSSEVLARRTDCTAVQLILVALLLQQDNGFELGTRLRAAGCGPIVLINDKFRESDLSWAVALGFAGLLRIPAPASWMMGELTRYVGSGVRDAGD